MGRHGPYRPGSFYRKDDRSGFPTRAEQTRQEWTGLIVSERLWEARQPQDLVKAVKDVQSVPKARPLPPSAFVGPFYVQITSPVPVGETVLPLASLAGINIGDRVGVMLNDGGYFYTQIAGLTGGDVVLADALVGDGAGADSLNNLMIDLGPGTLPVSISKLIQQSGYGIRLQQGGFLLHQ